MEIRALGYIGFSVSNLEEWASFASEELGLMLARRGDEQIDLRIDDYAWRIRLLQGAEDDIAFAGWEVADAEALGRLSQRLRDNGFEVSEGTDEDCADRHVEGLIRFQDPDGLTLEAFFGPLQLTQDPFVSSHGTRFKTSDQGLGHIVLSTQEGEQLTRFYQNVLQFKLSDHIHTEVVPGRPLSLSFYRCNGRHHSLAIAPARLPKRLVHFMLEATSIDDVGRTMYRVLDHSRHLSFTLGRHSNDEMLSFYVVTPSGFDLEFGWGGLAVDDDTWHVKTHNVNSAWGHRFQRPPKSGAA